MRSLLIALSLIPAAFSQAAETSPPLVAIVRGQPGKATSAYVLQRPGDTEPTANAATFDHLPWAVIRGAMLPGTRDAVVVADRVKRGDGSFGAQLLRLSPGVPAKLLSDRVFHATRPLVTPDGRVFVERGTEGAVPSEEERRAGHLRADAITIEEIDPDDGTARVVHRFRGYTAHLAGVLDDELILYRVRFGHAELIAVRTDGSKQRTLIGSMPAFARSFFVDAPRRRVLFVNASPADREWNVYSLDLETLALKVELTGATPAFAPFAWPDGRIAYSREGLQLKGPEGEAQRVLPDRGGMEALVASTHGGGWLAIVQERPSTLPVPWLLHSTTHALLPVPVPQGMRSDVLGLVGGSAR